MRESNWFLIWMPQAAKVQDTEEEDAGEAPAAEDDSKEEANGLSPDSEAAKEDSASPAGAAEKVEEVSSFHVSSSLVASNFLTEIS